jgi:GT2 family glycosyltransferase
MLLSIVIVNYRVRFFLEQCLHAVGLAISDIEAEVIVVDNHSADGSLEYLQPLFPWVQFISLSENLGFAKANNIGLHHASGSLVLFLNPDTLVSKQAITASIAVFESNTDVGALGIKMYDGSGRFLKESKRGFPSALTSFFKLAGLTHLFPHSSLFARYYLGHISHEENATVEVLAGAYMMLRQSLLQKIGGFDERFFMYAEDVDLSYRVLKAGMKNFYLAQSFIIHFKGESTRKGTLNYINIFYKAMVLYVDKHYAGTKAFFFRSILKVGIFFRAMLDMGSMALYTLGSKWEKAETDISNVPHEIVVVGTAQDFESVSSIFNVSAKQQQSFNCTWLNIEKMNTADILKTVSSRNKSIHTAFVFCFSRQFGLEDMEDVLKANRGNTPYSFHFRGSNSIVSSADTKGQGVVVYNDKGE